MPIAEWAAFDFLHQFNGGLKVTPGGGINAKANDPRWKQQMALLSTRKELQDSIQQIRDAVLQNGKELEAANAADPAERLKFLNSELAMAQARKLDVQNSLAAAEENIKRLQQRLADMEGQVT